VLYEVAAHHTER